MNTPTTVARRSEREFVVTHLFNAPAHLVFEAWTKPELFTRWWVPKSAGVTLLSCALDVRIGGGYRLEFAHPSSPKPMVFHGRYLDVEPTRRIVWSNEESADGAITTVTFEDRDGRTLLTFAEVYPSKEALDHAIAGMEEGMTETLSQLDELLLTLRPKAL